jgi:hypothetical protein
MIEKITENIKKLPITTTVVLGVQVLAGILAIFAGIRVLRMFDSIAYIYLYAGGEMPGKGTVYLTIFAAIAVIGAIYLLVSNPSETAVKIYFGTLVFNLIMGLIMNGFTFIGFTAGLVLPIWIGYSYYNDKSVLGLEDYNIK